MLLPHEQSVKTALNYACSENDMALILKLASRGVEMGKQTGAAIDYMLAAQDIATVHCNGTPLKLWQFLASDNDDFSHDFTAIGLWLDRQTGQLGGGIKLRFAEIRQ